MDAASCGPSNALQNLSKHSQRDNTLQNEIIRNQPQQGNSFRNQPMVDQSLNQDFQQFSNGQTFNQFQLAPVHHQLNQQHNQRSHHHAPQNQFQPQQGWVLDFSNMNINQKPVHQQGSAQSDWHQQFMNQRHPAQQVQSQGAYQAQRPMSGFNMNMRTNLSNSLYQTSTQNVGEHKEIHKLEEENQIFDDHFDQLERELQQEQATDIQVDGDEYDKEQFAKTAKQVHDSMLSGGDSETNSKFQNSDFLKLMSSISDRSVEISSEGDKLVQKQSGEDVRGLEDSRHSASPAPQQIHTQQPMGHPQVPHPHAPVNEPQASHLPDPLAHIKDGALSDISSPLQAAKVVSGNQVKTNDWMDEDDWLDMTEDTPFPVRGGPQRPRVPARRNIMTREAQEVYDDYRNDDDGF